MENLTTYFEVARDMLLGARLIDRNPNYDSQIPYSGEICITRPERISSYDETKMELYCTRVVVPALAIVLSE
jgi:hypothetical protein